MVRQPLRVALALMLVLGLALIGSLAPALAQDAATPAPTGVYDDPAGRFTVPVPTNWTVEEGDGYVTLRDPDGEITVYALAVTADSAEGGIRAAWAQVDPTFEATPPPGATQTVPSAPGVDETVVITYDFGQQSGRVVQAYAQRVDETVFVLLFTGSLDAAIRRNSQIQVIASGFTIHAVARADLTGVEPRRFTGALVAEFEAYVQELMRRTEVPGAAIAVVQDGRVVYAKGFGVKELGGADPVTPDTLMMIGSTTKSMTTMMLATEVDAGLLSWDTPVVELLPSFAVADPELTRRITVRNLVCACTGVPRRDLELLFNARALTPEQVIESLRDFTFFTGFGEAFQYSNQMVATAGYVGAAAAGGRYGELGEAYAAELRRRVLDPIGMARTTLSFADVLVDPDRATPHGANLRPAYVPISLGLEEIVLAVAPAGGIWSSANEMTRYLLTQLSRGVAPDGTRVVSAVNLEATWAPQVAVDAETSYGLGWFVGAYKGLRLIHHGGNTLGFTSDLAFLPDAGIGVVILTNAYGANLFTEGARARLLELLYDQPMEFDAQIAFALAQAEEAFRELVAQLGDRADPEAVAPYLGRYTSDALGEVTLTFADERLLFDAGEFQTALRPVTAAPPGAVPPGVDRYLMEDPPLPGTPVDLRIGDTGRPEIVLDVVTDRYVFVQSEQLEPATPVAAGVRSGSAADA